MKMPPHRPVSTPSAGASAAARREPGVCAVPRSNCAGLTIVMGRYLLIQERPALRLGLGAKTDLSSSDDLCLNTPVKARSELLIGAAMPVRPKKAGPVPRLPADQRKALILARASDFFAEY